MSLAPFVSTAPLIVEHVRNTAAKTVRVKDTEGASLLGWRIFKEHRFIKRSNC
jgi:hypothetical protein